MIRRLWMLRHVAVFTTLLGLAACTDSGCKSGEGAPEQDEEATAKKPSSSEAPEETAGSSAAESPSETSCEPPDVSDVTAEPVVDHSFERPVYVDQPPGSEDVLYVVEKRGVVQIVEDGELRDEPFLDIRERVGLSHNERGLLGLAFHPDYESNGRFFIYYTPKANHRNVVAEYRRAEGAQHRASDDEKRRLVEVDDPEGNHNGGMITFGPDGYLYVGMGDGGGAGDQHGKIGNGQNRDTPLGSILRLDVDAADRDFAASDNPFVGGDGDPRIWLWGLRNPWRFAFDPETGDMYIGDVGQNKIEEIDVQPASAPGGRNFGWRAYEGTSVYDSSLTDRVDDHVEPVVEFEHQSEKAPIRDGCSVTGGYVYRGDEIEGLEGAYLYGDYCSKDVAAFRYCDGEAVGHQRVPGLVDQGSGLASFGRDNDGELYLVYDTDGTVQKIVPDD